MGAPIAYMLCKGVARATRRMALDPQVTLVWARANVRSGDGSSWSWPVGGGGIGWLSLGGYSNTLISHTSLLCPIQFVSHFSFVKSQSFVTLTKFIFIYIYTFK